MVAAVWTRRALTDTPLSDGGWSSYDIARTSRGRGPLPSRHSIHVDVIGHVWVAAVLPTTRPKWPARRSASKTWARGAARRMPRTASGWPMSSTSPTKARIGTVSSVNDTTLPRIENPPVIMRLWTTNWVSNSATAGPDQATHPSMARNRR